MNSQSSPRADRPLLSYRWLLAAALLSIMLAQMVAMVMVTRSQVVRAEVRESAERTGLSGGLSSEAAPADASSHALITVGLSAAR